MIPNFKKVMLPPGLSPAFLILQSKILGERPTEGGPHFPRFLRKQKAVLNPGLRMFSAYLAGNPGNFISAAKIRNDWLSPKKQPPYDGLSSDRTTPREHNNCCSDNWFINVYGYSTFFFLKKMNSATAKTAIIADMAGIILSNPIDKLVFTTSTLMLTFSSKATWSSTKTPKV